MRWVKFERSSADAIMIAKRIPIPNGGDDVEGSCGNNVNGFIPTWIEVGVDDSGLCKSLLILVTKNYIRIAKAIRIARFEVFCLDNLDGEDVFLDLLLSLHWRS